FTRKPVPPVVEIVKFVKLNVPAAAPVRATPPAPPLRFTLVTVEPPVFVPAMAAPPLPAMSTASTRLPEARATVPESDGRFAGVRPVPPAAALFFTYQTRDATVIVTVEVSVPPLPSETV